MTIEDQVAALDDREFARWAQRATQTLRCFGHAFVELAPGDMTVYRIAILKNGDRYWVATEFGPMYQMNPDITDTHWEYVAEKWLPHMRSSQEWTARVLARFLNLLREKLKED